VVDFARPEGIVWVDVDPETGQAVPSWFGGKSYKEIFNENNVPEYQITNAYCL